MSSLTNEVWNGLASNCDAQQKIGRPGHSLSTQEITVFASVSKESGEEKEALLRPTP